MNKECSMHGRDEKCINSLVGKPGEKGPLGKPRDRWEDLIFKN
jgi:hypothetical protein